MYVVDPPQRIVCTTADAINNALERGPYSQPWERLRMINLIDDIREFDREMDARQYMRYGYSVL